MNLFAKPEKAAEIPSVDEAQERVSGMRRMSRMRRRAANMLVTGAANAPTAARQVTGN